MGAGSLTDPSGWRGPAWASLIDSLLPLHSTASVRDPEDSGWHESVAGQGLGGAAEEGVAALRTPQEQGLWRMCPEDVPENCTSWGGARSPSVWGL